MEKKEFIARLTELLQNLPEEERAEAVNYYEEYFADAGESREAETIAELGSPEQVAATIRENLYGREENGGVYTETGYHKSTARPIELELVPKESGKQTETGGETAKQDTGEATKQQSFFEDIPTSKQKKNPVLTGIFIVLFAIPIGILFFVAVSVAIALLSAVFGVVIAIAAVTVTLLITGVILAVVGIAHLASSLPSGLVLCGIGFLLFGIGVLCLMLSVWICGTLLPAAVKGIIRLCKGNAHRGKENMA